MTADGQASGGHCDNERDDDESQHQHIGPEDRAQHATYLHRWGYTPRGTGVMRYFAAQGCDFGYRMIAIAGRFAEFGREVDVRGSDMATRDDDSDSEGMLPDVAARLGLIETRIAQPLTEEQRDEVRNRISRSIALGVALRTYPLTNADEPEIGLDPYRGNDR